jgi:signal transduction histidine kinase
MRRLYAQIWATLLGALLVFGLLGASSWWLFGPGREERLLWRGSLGPMAARALPGPQAPRAELEAALRELGRDLGAELTLRDPAGRVLAGPDAPLEERRRRGPRRATSIELPDGRRLDARHDHAGPPALLAGLLGLALATAIAAYPVVRGLTRRLEHLRAQVDALGAGELSARVDVRGRDEIAGLAASFNRTAERIEQLVAAQRGTLALASHELRSPLARIRVAVELCEGASGEALRARVSRDIAELDALIGELLVASRLDALEAGQALDHRESVDLLALAAEEAAQAGAELQGEPAQLAGDPALLRRLLRNLLENARRHGGGGPIELAVAPLAARGARLWVEDRGPGVPAAERERIFEPFYRLAGSREAQGGVGLGLSLVRQIARRHGGEARCLPRPGGGSRFEVDLPGAAEPPFKRG